MGCVCVAGRLNTELCRLCHGRFSPRKLRRAFGTQPDPVTWPSSPERSESEPSTPRFCSDFQQLLGVSVRHDSTLSPYICSDCHAQFYQCHSILQAFRHRVNLTPSLNNTERWIHSTHLTPSLNTNTERWMHSTLSLKAVLQQWYLSFLSGSVQHGHYSQKNQIGHVSVQQPACTHTHRWV